MKFVKTEKIGKHTVIDSCKVGKGTVIWHFCNLYQCVIGENCTVGSHVEIGRGVTIGDRCKIEAFAFIPPGVTIEDGVFVGPHVCFTNDLYPSATKTFLPGAEIETLVKKRASIGANSTILCGIIIGEDSLIGAGSVVTEDVPPNSVVYGNSAQVRRTK